MQFKVATDVFSGPMDLLLYLVKREEVVQHSVPVSGADEDTKAASGQ